MTTLRSQDDVQTAFAQLIDLQEFMDSSPVERFRTYKLVNDLLGEVVAARNEMQDLLFDSMEGDIVDLPGIGVFQRVRSGKYTKWDGEAVRRAVEKRFLAKIADDVPNTADLVCLAMADIAECAGLHRPSHGWATTQLKARGIAPSSFAEYEQGTSKKVNIVA